MERGGAIRATGETKMNEMSSRSHAVFIVIAEQSETTYVDDRGEPLTAEEFQRFMHSKGARREQDMKNIESHLKQSFKVGKLNLVDLAGSERVRLSGATGQRLKESQQINRSLAQLGNVISALTEAKGRQHIPYRDSKLTRMLEDSLGGNCKTTMMAMISPAFEAMQETISTLNFANRAKNIKNEAKVNEDLDQKSLLRKYERELKKLRAELEERNKNVVDKRRLLELDEQRRRAEADKMTAIRALEATSLEFMHEKEEKKKLEQRIAMLMGQMLRGDKTGPDGGPAREGEGNISLNPEIHIMMKEQQEKLSKEYQFKLADLERERETIEEEKAQVDRYKQLLLKQRDIMIALTQRLVERDEQIMALQDELDAYDSHHKELEEKLDEKTAMLIKLQRISMEVNATSPYKNEELNKALGESWSRQDGGRSSGATEVVNDEDSLSSPHVRTTIENQRNRIAELEQMLSSAGGSPKQTTKGEVENLLQSELDAILRQIQDTPGALSAKDTIRKIIGRVISKVNGHQLAPSSAQSESRGGALGRSGEDSAAMRALKEEVSSSHCQFSRFCMLVFTFLVLVPECSVEGAERRAGGAQHECIRQRHDDIQRHQPRAAG
jgi:kinesin family protein 3/17